MNNQLQRVVPALPPDPGPRLTRDQRGLGAILMHLLTTIEAKPVPPPSVPADLSNLPPLLRIHGCIRLFVLDLEFSLSAGGQLRSLAKLACRISLAVGILSMFAAAALACVSVIVAIAVAIAGQVVLLLWYLLEAAMLVLALVVMAIVLFMVVGLIVRSR